MATRRGAAGRSRAGAASHLSVLPGAGLVDLEPYATRLVDVELGSRPSARTVIRRAISGSTADLLEALPIAEIGADPEGVHRSRVALRRLRSDLRTFDDLLITDRLEPVADEVRRLGTALGAVRDLDVLEELLETTVARLDDPLVRAHLPDLLAVLDAQRRRARRSLSATLRDPRTPQLFDRLIELADDPPTVQRALGRASRRLRRPVRRRWRRLRATVDRLAPDPPTDDLHRVRIQAKRARYAAEAVTPVYGRPVRRFAAAAAGLQSELGDLRDAELASAWLREAAVGLDADGGFAAGRIAQFLHDRAAAHRADWATVFERVRDRAERAELD